MQKARTTSPRSFMVAGSGYRRLELHATASPLSRQPPARVLSRRAISHRSRSGHRSPRTPPAPRGVHRLSITITPMRRNAPSHTTNVSPRPAARPHRLEAPSATAGTSTDALSALHPQASSPRIAPSRAERQRSTGTTITVGYKKNAQRPSPADWYIHRTHPRRPAPSSSRKLGSLAPAAPKPTVRTSVGR